MSPTPFSPVLVRPAVPLPAAAPACPDFLGRLPIPLRRPFKAGLDRVVSGLAAAGGPRPECCFLAGAEWYRPFDRLSGERPDELPGLLLTPVQPDLLQPALLAHYAPATPPAAPAAASHPAVAAAGLPDPQGIFNVFGLIPFVFLIDEKRLAGRPAPRTWSDLLDPCWAGEIVFGGWRPNEAVPYQDYNSYLLYALQCEFGDAGLRAFAANVRHLQHNIRTATQAGSNARTVGAIAILPWLQAALCPRRERTRVAWPADGALVMPLATLRRPAAAALRDIEDYIHGAEFAAVLARNCYPSSLARHAGLPPAARLKWPGWTRLRQGDMAAEGRRAAAVFFAAWQAREGQRACS